MLFYSCDEKETDINLNWQELTGDYTGDFSYEMYRENKDYWFVVKRKVSFSQVSPNTFKIIFRDTSYSDIDFHLTTRNPYLDTTLNKQINLESLDLQLYEVENVEEPSEGTLTGHLRITNEDYEEYSAIIGIKYIDNEEYTESIHIILERFLPIGAESPDSTESISFHAYR